jgi:ribosomal protein L24E
MAEHLWRAGGVIYVRRNGKIYRIKEKEVTT